MCFCFKSYRQYFLICRKLSKSSKTKLIEFSNCISFSIFSQHDHIEVVPRDQFGVFHDENTYIIYAAAVKGTFSDQNTIVSARMGEIR